MSRKKWKNLFFSLIMSLLCLGTMACTTAIVHAGRQDAGDPEKELGGMKAALEGIDTGETDVQEKTYRRILIPSARNGCNSTKKVELLLPLQKDGNERAILREAMEGPRSGPTINIFDSITAVPPLNESSDLFLGTRNDTIRSWLEGLPLQADELSDVVLGYDDPTGNRLVVMYRTGDTAGGVRTVPVESDMDWVCRSRAGYALLTLSYPVAVAVDIVTFPVQLVLFVLSAH